MHDFQLLHDEVYKAGMTANALVEQFDQECTSLHIELNQHEQCNTIINVDTICDKSKGFLIKLTTLQRNKDKNY